MILIALDGVLRDPTGNPILDGVRLYSCLTGTTKVTVLADIHTVEAEHWLKSNGLTSHDETLGNEVGLPDVPLRKRQVEYAQQGSFRLPTVIVSDPDEALLLIKDGVSTLLFGAQRHSLPSMRMDRAKAKSWNEIMKENAQRQSLPFEEYE